MSIRNPAKAINALLPLPIKCGDGKDAPVVRPMTLGMWAALERIKSPMITGVDATDTLELLPSLYLITHDPREVFTGNLLDLAMQWADTQPVETIELIKAAVYRQFEAVLDVIPETDGKTSKKN